MNYIQTARKLSTAIMVSACFVLPSVCLADEKGTAIAQSVYDRLDGQNMVTKTIMVLQGKGSQPRSREFFSYRKDLSNGEIHSLIRFVKPEDVEDTGLLTNSHADGENDQWLYLPAMKSVRRIAGDRKGGRFVGSDIYFEDLQDRKVRQDTHTYIKKEEWNGTLCDVIESVPAKAGNSTYSKRISWVHPETLIPVKVDFYQYNQQEPVKRLAVKKIDKVQGFWTVMESEIEDLKDGHVTQVQVEKAVYDKDLPDSLFSQSILQDPAQESAYRP